MTITEGTRRSYGYDELAGLMGRMTGGDVDAGQIGRAHV